jgi:cytidylate kinase
VSGFVVAIDGPAASGKSTTARRVADRLDFVYLDTGAMYRAVTWKALETGTDLGDQTALGALASSIRLEFRSGESEVRVLVDGEDVTEELREPRISRAVSEVSSVPAVRRAMVRTQRNIGAEGRCVVEGRDIGTVVFPNAPVKIFLAASLEERARRRRRELSDRGVIQGLEALMEEIRTRDAMDSEREDSPLRQAEDAIVIDTTRMTIEEQVAEVVRVAQAALPAASE